MSRHARIWPRVEKKKKKNRPRVAARFPHPPHLFATPARNSPRTIKYLICSSPRRLREPPVPGLFVIHNASKYSGTVKIREPWNDFSSFERLGFERRDVPFVRFESSGLRLTSRIFASKLISASTSLHHIYLGFNGEIFVSGGVWWG